MTSVGDGPSTNDKVPLSTGVPARIRVGFNYPWSHELYGAQIGPNPWVSPWDTEWPRQQRLAESGKVGPPDIPWPELFKHAERNLINLKKMGIEVVRWFLLGNFFSYGVGGAQRKHHLVPPGFEIWDYEFTPPAKPDPRYKFHFEELLKIFKRTEMKFIPVFCDFPIAQGCEHGTDRVNTRVAGRRADCITDPKKRDVLLAFMQELVDVAARTEYKDVVEAWDVCNEPYWLSSPIFGLISFPPFIVRRGSDLNLRGGVMSRKVVIEFLEAALKIVKGRLKSTVGHRYYEDLSIYPKGDVSQFHYYASKIQLPGPLALVADISWHIDPESVPKLSGDDRPILGEFAAQQGGHGGWRVPDPDVKSFQDRNTFDRLKLLEDKGYRLALLWNQQMLRPKKKKDGTPILDAKGHQVYKAEDWVKLTEEVRKDITKYTGKPLVPVEPPDLDWDEL